MKEKQTVSSIIEKHESKVQNKLAPDFDAAGLNYENLHLAIVAFKKEEKLIVYARNKINQPWVKLNTYPFTTMSGVLGPKLKEGDKQIPEGIYQIESLNPNSAYHLSLRVNYPNDFDKEKARIDGRTDIGSDIMIHGKSDSVGCIAIGDEAIEELFVLAANSFSHTIPIIISPIDLRKHNSQFSINELEWSAELYDSIKEVLKDYH